MPPTNLDLPPYFTERAKRELNKLALDEAARLRHEYIGTEHILLAIIADGEGVAAAILQNLGADLEQLRAKIDKTVKRGESPSAPDLPFTTRAKKVVELAMAEARELGHAYVGDQHLLLGLLREEKGIAGQVLADSSVNLETARTELRRLLGDEITPGTEHREVPTPNVNVEDIPPGLRRIMDHYGVGPSTIGPAQHVLAAASRFVVVADQDLLSSSSVVRVMAALDLLHRSWGGAGLVLDGQHAGTAVAECELAPR